MRALVARDDMTSTRTCFYCGNPVTLGAVSVESTDCSTNTYAPAEGFGSYSGSTDQHAVSARKGLKVLSKAGKSQFKRGLDVVLSIAAVIILIPFLLLLAFAIKIDGGPVLFAHNRIGKSGVIFKCYKLRTMRTESDAQLLSFFNDDERAQLEWKTHYKLKDDPRITPLGRLLRKSSLDELPQLFNVIKGDMSLVGPRPIIREELELYGDNVSHYLSTRPGITGLWQVSGRNDLDYAERVALDTEYVQRWRHTLDWEILVKTIGVVLSQRGAY